ncbi:hypothetical protein BGZ61DRAFT_593233, partial [Ilyonectria robusta]|uniref:uncharacterized protein n=1 Tax=Ilyonectria robusta TaxID=1079257 RepID=UPI001E8DF9F9
MTARLAFHPWTESTASPRSYYRTLATQEFMLSILNDYAFVHSCPYLGVTVSLQDSEKSSASFSAEDLQSRIARAFIYTRWLHPTVACQIKDAKHMVYKVEEAANVKKWAARTVQTVESSSGWRELLAKLSREVVLPSKDGDCAFLYLLVRPLQSSKSRINQFDLLLHVHHGLVDGAGIRSIMNEVLVGLTKLSPTTSHSWGEEVERLGPTALDVAVISDEATNSLIAMQNEFPLPLFAKPVAQSPRPVTAMVTHTIKDAGFLDRLLKSARANDVKLTAVVQAAIALTFYDEAKPTEEETCKILSAFDLRTQGTEASANDRFWAVARHIQGAWTSVAQRQDAAAANKLRRPATGIIIQHVLADINRTSSNMRLYVNYVSDPPGSKQFDGVYDMEGDGQTKLVLDRYQLVTEERTPKLSCRSHS